jgi:hypothetical protein
LPEADAVVERLVGAPYILNVDWEFDRVSVLVRNSGTLALTERSQYLIVICLGHK